MSHAAHIGYCNRCEDRDIRLASRFTSMYPGVAAGSFVCPLGAIWVGVMTFTQLGATSRVTMVKVKS